MALVFYPHPDDAEKGTLQERIEILRDAAERFKAIVLDTTPAKVDPHSEGKRAVPRDIKAAYNWDEIARVLREIRDLPEATKTDKAAKAEALTKLGEIYEVLRGAKMSKLEAVRLALLSEANHLRGSSSQVV